MNLKLLGKRGYSVNSNRETGNGRIDILIQEYQKRKLAVIIEVKAASESGMGLRSMISAVG